LYREIVDASLVKSLRNLLDDLKSIPNLDTDFSVYDLRVMITGITDDMRDAEVFIPVASTLKDFYLSLT